MCGGVDPAQARRDAAVMDDLREAGVIPPLPHAFPSVEVIVDRLRVPRAVRVDGAEIRRVMKTQVRYEANSVPVVDLTFRAGSFAETVETVEPA